eukprot:2884301-Lingulodinium_polyedra.AAC.1
MEVTEASGPAGDGSDGRPSTTGQQGDFLGDAHQDQGGVLVGASRYAKHPDEIPVVTRICVRCSEAFKRESDFAYLDTNWQFATQ